MKNTLEEVLTYRKEMFGKSITLVESKGKEYCGKEQAAGDSLHNYRIHEKIGWDANEEDYPLRRVLEKIQRLHSMLTNENISTAKYEEDVVDVHNILDYVGLMRRTRMSQRVEFKAHAEHQEYKYKHISGCATEINQTCNCGSLAV